MALTEGEVIQLTQDIAEAVGLLNVGVALFAGGNNPTAQTRGALMISAAFRKLGQWQQKLQAEAQD